MDSAAVLPALMAGGTVAVAARCCLWTQRPAPPLLDEAESLIDPAWQAEALAAHLRAYRFEIPNPDDAASDKLTPGETSTTSAGDWFPTPHGLLLGKPPQLSQTARAVRAARSAQHTAHLLPAGIMLWLAGEALAEKLIYSIEGKEAIELGAGIANHSVLLHRCGFSLFTFFSLGHPG